MKDYISFNRKQRNIGQLLVGAMLLALSVLVSVSLLTYNAQDQSFLYYSDIDRHIFNHMGFVGAHLSAGLFYLLGISAYLLIPFLLYTTAVGFGLLDAAQEWDRVLASWVAILTTSVFATMSGGVAVGTMIFSGGLIGYSLEHLALAFIELPMLWLLVGFTMFSSLIIITRLAIVLVPYKTACAVASFIQEQQLLQKLFHAVQVFFVTLFMVIYSILVWVVEVASGRIASRYPELFTQEDDVQSLEDIAYDSFWNEDDNGHEQEESDVVYAKSKYDYEEQPEMAFQEYGKEDEYTSAEKYEEMKRRHQPKPEHVYTLPDLSIFTAVEDVKQDDAKQEFLKQRAATLENKLEHFGIQGKVTSIEYGPVITLFEYKPNVDIKVSKILALEDDLALALKATSIRIIAPVPGKAVVGFEVANEERQNVMFSNIVLSKEYQSYKGSLPLILGSDSIGKDVIVDLLDMPHLLVAGSTGSGKSVALNTMLMSLLCKKSPDEMRLILVDPKRLEFSSFADMAHLLFPIVIQPNMAIDVLKWVVQTMEERYEAMAEKGVRNILEYHKQFGKAGVKEMPFIVLVIDELADLMMTTGKQIEDLIVRVAQMARAAGIHMIVATQRPSVDVITGLIKVNFPSRVSFRVTSKVDSRTILDMIGAEKLLGRGDMLFMNSHAANPQRVHGAYVSNDEIERVVKHIRKERAPQYLDLATLIKSEDPSSLLDGDDDLFKEVVEYLKEVDEISISSLQRKFRIGYNRSARIMESLEMAGHIMAHDGGKMRKVIHHESQEVMKENN